MKLARLGAVCAFAVSLISTPSHAELVDNGGGLIYDTVLDITWAQQRSDNRMNWEEAKTWAAGLTLGGVGGWRLPYISVVEGAGPFLGPAIECDQTSEEACRDNEMGYMFYQNLSGTRFDPVTDSRDPVSYTHLRAHET